MSHDIIGNRAWELALEINNFSADSVRKPIITMMVALAEQLLALHKQRAGSEEVAR
ncbi:MAG: hypothetical protein H8E47_13825 [Anaerolineales bacterium]|nr:hypothetical protein [Anaerolineales bacterium]